MDPFARRRPATEPGLASRLAGSAGWRPSLRLAVAAATFAVVVVMALFVADLVAHELRSNATESALHNVETIVRGYVDPTITDQSLLIDAPADGSIAAQLDRITISGDIRRINIWSPDGRIVYSNDPELRGRHFSIGPAVATAFAGESVSRYAAGADGSIDIGRSAKRYLEIYVPIRGAVDGSAIGVYEVHQDAAPIEDRVAATRTNVFLIALVASSVLVTLLWLAYAGASQLLARQNRQLRERAATEQILTADIRRSEERFRSLVRNASDCIVIARADGTVAYESPAVERVLGYAAPGRLGQPAFERVHPDDRPWVGRLFGEVALTPEAQTSAEFRVAHRDGSWRSLEAVSKNLLDDPAVRGIVVNYRDITERKVLEDQLRHQVFHDPLTGLPNRALFMDRLEHARARIRGAKPRLAVAFLDLDDFKGINDRLGHAAGDQLLVDVAARIRSTLREGDTAARMGGDEFAILLEDAPRAAGAEVVQRVIEALRKPFAISGREVFVHASAGIALHRSRRETAEELLRNADDAMYLSKTHGKDRLTIFRPSLHDATIERLHLKSDLQQALERGELRLLYQPVAELQSGVVCSVEALIRWQHPRRGLLGPTDFIPLAEESGMIVSIGRWVLAQACRQVQAWRELPHGRELTVAVNLSARQVEDAGLLDDVTAALRDSGLPAGCLTLEITESVLMADIEPTIRTLRAVKALGVRLAIDDFGTGYSSLSYLRRLPVDILKIDRSFVATLDTSEAEATLVRSILSLAGSLDLETIAEGIEHAGQLRELLALGARLGQGFFFARPLDPEALTAVLALDGAESFAFDTGPGLTALKAAPDEPTEARTPATESPARRQRSSTRTPGPISRRSDASVERPFIAPNR